MRTVIDIPEQYIKELASICQSKNVSRAEAVRQAIAGYVETNRSDSNEAFGLWKARQIDGLEYQTRLRSEW